MESRFMRDFSHVRVHTDPAAARSAQEIQARAYKVWLRIASGIVVTSERLSYKFAAFELIRDAQSEKPNRTPDLCRAGIVVIVGSQYVRQRNFP